MFLQSGSISAGTWIRVVALERGSAASLPHSFRGSPAPTARTTPILFKISLQKMAPVGPPIGDRFPQAFGPPAERRQLKKACRSLGLDIQVLSDVEAAWLAAFGDSTNTGILFNRRDGF